MPANTAPIFTLTPNVAWATVTAANTAMDGTGTVNLVFTGNTNGSFVQRIIARALGTCTASVVRIFLNNGSTNTSAANNTLIADVTLPATTASNTASLTPIDIPLNIVIPNTYRLYATLGTAVSAGWALAGVGGDY